MLIKEIYEILNSISPFELQEKWDNSGLIIGDMNREFNEIKISLDLDEKLILESNNDVLFITHHPLIFSKIKNINFDKYPNNFIEIMIKKKYIFNIFTYEL